jgi:DDE family transposase
VTAGYVKRLRIDGKATVSMGDGSRGGLTRGDNQACDHDLGLHEKSIPCGIVDEASGQWHMTFGSSYKTSDVILDALEAWGAALDETEQVAMARLQIKRENGPESRGRRTPFLQRRVAFCDVMGKPMQLVYSPPYHRKYNPLERCWGILAWPWNGTKLVDVEPMWAWARV